MKSDMINFKHDMKDLVIRTVKTGLETISGFFLTATCINEIDLPHMLSVTAFAMCTCVLVNCAALCNKYLNEANNENQ